jgi:hypothetical protein
MELGRTFFHPEFFRRGTLPQPDAHNTDLANGFGFTSIKYLVREDGTEVDPTSRGCMCGKWMFYAYGCKDIFKECNVGQQWIQKLPSS